MLLIGLTGGIGTGKSTVCGLFAERGVPVIDADLVAREVVEPGTTGLRQLIAAFGDEILDEHGRLDRRAMRQRIFVDQAQRRRLEIILHPLIREEILRRIHQIEAPYCILCIPLLLETGRQYPVQRVLVIDAPDELRLQRIQERDGIDRHQAQAIINSQIDRATRLRAADDLITNNGELEHLRRQVENLHQYYLEIAAARA
ncbi:MAG: dephospho-CoA kinase [Gammaproteobacteria bacterium RBG_16_57_12]|nr:MAG: dephospho-CoA kinase [Gammaproteobacteria bacterium RBG_16_57_12]